MHQLQYCLLLFVDQIGCLKALLFNDYLETELWHTFNNYILPIQLQFPHTHRETERIDRQRERETDRQTDRQTERQTCTYVKCVLNLLWFIFSFDVMLNLHKTNSGNPHTQTQMYYVYVCVCGLCVCHLRLGLSSVSVSVSFSYSYSYSVVTWQQMPDKSVELVNPFIACNTSICWLVISFSFGFCLIK